MGLGKIAKAVTKPLKHAKKVLKPIKKVKKYASKTTKNISKAGKYVGRDAKKVAKYAKKANKYAKKALDNNTTKPGTKLYDSVFDGVKCSLSDIQKATSAMNSLDDIGTFGFGSSITAILNGMNSDIKWGCAAENLKTN